LNRLLLRLILASLVFGCGQARAQLGASVLHIAGERLTDLALGYPQHAQVARLGFVTSQKPWHTWFAGVDMRPLVHLPGYQAGQPVRMQSSMLIGNRFQGKTWSDAFAALASFDSDSNGIVEGGELRDLYVWVDFAGDGTVAQREDALRPASYYYTAFDLRAGAKTKAGHARTGRIAAFSVLVPYATRIHLLELDVSASYATRLQGALLNTAAGRSGETIVTSPLNGRWHWTITNADQWKDATRPWGKEAGGQLILAALKTGRIEGVVQYVGPHADLIKLPLEGHWQDGRAQWTSVSPLGLTRSEARLESLFGHPVLRARSWSNRNGKVQEWTWEARYDQPLD
jgi:hypothetical protein